LSTALDLPTVSYPEWFASLEKSGLAQANATTTNKASKAKFRRSNPSVRILKAFHGMLMASTMGGNRDFAGQPMLSVENAKKASQIMRDESLAQLGPGNA
jgi:hypothetical protein